MNFGCELDANFQPTLLLPFTLCQHPTCHCPGVYLVQVYPCAPQFFVSSPFHHTFPSANDIRFIFEAEFDTTCSIVLNPYLEIHDESLGSSSISKQGRRESGKDAARKVKENSNAVVTAPEEEQY